MSVSIKLKNVVKKYGDLTIIPNLSLRIKEGEFFTLLGPSGCGKTTLLRMIAGFNSIEGGEIKFNETVINNLAPEKRNIGMVFQNYAIFPHMTVKQNIAFGLKNRKVPRDETEKRVNEIMKTVQIENLKDRMPEKLSGGQQQRVALARAIVIAPDVLLMDEPLSNLDAKLRVDMRNAIKEIQNSISITTVYVTHDQEEAMAVSDRIAVMKDGIIQQVGAPQGIYLRPANLTVATFIGRTNVIDGILENGILRVGSYKENINNLDKATVPEGSVKVKVSVRPEEFVLSNNENGMKAEIINSVFLGQSINYFAKLEDGQKIEITQESNLDSILPAQTKASLLIKIEKINIFSEDGGLNYVKGVVNDVQEG